MARWDDPVPGFTDTQNYRSYRQSYRRPKSDKHLSPVVLLVSLASIVIILGGIIVGYGFYADIQEEYQYVQYKKYMDKIPYFPSDVEEMISLWETEHPNTPLPYDLSEVTRYYHEKEQNWLASSEAKEIDNFIKSLHPAKVRRFRFRHRFEIENSRI